VDRKIEGDLWECAFPNIKAQNQMVECLHVITGKVQHERIAYVRRCFQIQRYNLQVLCNVILGHDVVGPKLIGKW
jgi:hypothetical protein